MNPPDTTASSAEALSRICHASGMDPQASRQLDMPEQPQLFPSSFAAAALAAEQIYFARTAEHQTVSVNKNDAERECCACFTLDGTAPDAWEKFSGLYATRDGHVRIHANFVHHRDGVLQLLKLPAAEQCERDDVAAALAQWSAEEFETAAAGKGLVVSMIRTFKQWDLHPHAQATHHLPLMSITRTGDAPPRALPPVTLAQLPLQDVRVLDLTRILAGPIGGRTLAAYGADVLLINAPNLPNISSITDTSRGKRSAHIDLTGSSGPDKLHHLLQDTHIFVQGYRPQAIAGLGFSPEALANTHPGVVYVSLSAYANTGPWSQRRGFDSLVQAATGFNHAEAEAANAAAPKTLPLPILDYVSGFLMAHGAQVALQRQMTEGGSWHVEVSLLQTASWLRGLGRQAADFAAKRPSVAGRLQEFPCDHGVLLAMPHAAHFSATPPEWVHPSAMPGSHPPTWD